MTKSENFLPTESLSQRIGRLAAKGFEANIPNSWMPTPLTHDFGFDYEVQVEDAAQLQDTFRSQLKGTTEPKRSVDGSFISVELEASTVRYYANVTDPIMLVLCDLSSDLEQPKNCPLYYMWIEDKLRALNEEGISAEQSTITFRVPTANRLDSSTNVLRELKRFRKLAQASKALDVVVEEKYPQLGAGERADLVARIPTGFRARGAALLESITQDPERSWPAAPRGSLPWLIQRTSEHLKQGAAVEAASTLQEAEPLLSAATPIELADYWLQAGRLQSALLNDQGARDALFRSAEAANFRGEFAAAWAESEIRLRYDIDQQTSFSDVLEKLKDCNDPFCIGVRSRLFAAEGRYAEAVAEAGRLESDETLAAAAIVHTMQAASSEALDACDKGLARKGLREATRSLFMVLRARALFSLGVGVHNLKPGEVLPPSGPVGTNAERIKAAWEQARAVLLRLRAAAWPSNVEFIADVWAATSTILGRQVEGLALIREAAVVRPSLENLQKAVETLALQCDESQLAIEANARLPNTPENSLRRVALLHSARKDAEAVEAFAAIPIDAVKEEPLFSLVVGAAALSADRVVRPALADEWARLLLVEERYWPAAAYLKFLRAVHRAPLSREIELDALYERYEELGHPADIGLHIVHELDPAKERDARRIVEVSTRVRGERQLSADTTVHVAIALVTTHQWAALLELAERAARRFLNDSRLRALRALALDRLGNTVAARASLEELLGDGSADSVALNVYVNIVTRCGFTEEAIEAVERILSIEQKAASRIECLRLLFSVVHTSDPLNPRCLEVAWRMGAEVNQDDEIEEGVFLMCVLLATVPATIQLGNDRKAQFQGRLERYRTKFPSSKVLKFGHFDSSSSSEMLRLLRQMTGFDPQREAWRLSTLSQLRKGQQPVPFEWRPRNILESIPDVVTLWELGKLADPKERQFHLSMVTDTAWVVGDINRLRARIPLLDITALLVIDDLELWPWLFDVFDRIAVSQATLVQLQRMLSPMSGTPYRERCRALIEALKGHFARVLQPMVGTDAPGDEAVGSATTNELRTLSAQGTYTLYSDDAAFRAYCEPEPKGRFQAMCTLDLLAALDVLQHATPIQVAEKLAQLCRWNVGIVVPVRYQVAALPADLGVASDIDKGVDALRGNATSNTIFSAIWRLEKEYKALQAHGAALLRILLTEPSNKIESVAAVGAFWLSKVRFHKDFPAPPLRGLAVLISDVVATGDMPSKATIQRVWQVYRAIVAMEHRDRMDVQREREGTVTLGRTAADLDRRIGLSGDKSLFKRLENGLIEGTSDWDDFRRGYRLAV